VYEQSQTLAGYCYSSPIVAVHVAAVSSHHAEPIPEWRVIIGGCVEIGDCEKERGGRVSYAADRVA
jgi:hypothetical protein